MSSSAYVEAGRSTLARLVLGLALGLALAWLIRGPGFDQLGDRASTFSTIFLGIFIEAAPFLMLGTVASGMVEEFISPATMRRIIPGGRFGGPVAGAALGFLFPVCECGTVPLARRLYRKGMPLPVGIAFLLAAPVINPIVLASTVAAFGWTSIVALRFGLTALIAVATGLIFSVESRPQRLLKSPALVGIQGGSGEAVEGRTLGARLNRAFGTAGQEFFEMGQYLVLGSLLAALLQTVIPQSSLLAFGSGPLLSVLVMLALGVILSVCSTVDSFVALAFAGSFSQGSILAFLVYGPMVDIKSTLMYLRVFNRKTVAYLILLPLALSLAAAVFMNLYL